MSDTQETKQHYFLVSGEVEFTEVSKSKTEFSRAMKVNGIQVWKDRELPAAALAKIQTTLQLHFHQKYSKTHKAPPKEVTGVTIMAIIHLGEFTNEEFMKDAPSSD